jgi:phosphoribosylformylglycinamidine synthase
MDVALASAAAEEVVRDDELLFSESQSRFVATVRPEHAAEFERLFAGRPAARVGVVTARPVLVLRGLTGSEVVRSDLSELKAAWQETLRNI